MTKLSFAVKKKGTNFLELESRGRGLVVRFWGCNLRCPLCFAQSYAFYDLETSRQKMPISLERLQDKIAQELEWVSLIRLQWIRIEGGEPLASPIHSEFVNKIIGSFGKIAKKIPLVTIVIQTNGVWLGLNLDNTRLFYEGVASTLRSIEDADRLRVALEISFKGPNDRASEVYSGAKGTLKLQYDGFRNSLTVLEGYWSEGLEIAVYPVAGFGPSFEDQVIIPIDPETVERGVETPLFHKDTWSTEFNEVLNMFQDAMRSHEDIYRRYIESHGGRLHMYGLELRGRKWQGAWIRRALTDDNLRSFARKYLRLNMDAIRYAGYFRKPLEDLKLNNVSTSTLGKVRQMRWQFVELKPAKHYPYL